MTTVQFRASFPEFSDIARFSDEMITMYLAVATSQVNPCRWGTQTDFGISLYTAHELVLAAQNQKAANIGGVSGQSAGIANSKTVGSVTVSYDSNNTSEKNGGYWNLTTYGKKYLRFARIYGAGVIQL